ncbi:hypothetical protein TBS_02860 [Thermobispora bispora]|jgi:hypothetical protein|uniref:Uncharacterized protein n=1 Tax=Thermobispora bispora (strain ATCC 19993 / DSM 43833 / CBS 139.67 / JCM 10125 / KCTC 9307 / NBRC 14880 / R51) TaxID=469371 RepID=D6Y9A6_THEBD|nr:hypothetical protein [Thermobispora bispora]MBO2474193.1 hypothetical protein [Actinomycetales bacterium]MDI9580540.1 hypothetical protein [Thermobispora sp.]ADG88026.1 hypothetical protein Tbis_1307 [Thermobispora bispora DSM 43833]MBX6167092.1 hypothetical protein [Thermobispora bispora]QSI47894.1 hypothetical protein CYL17_08455 [Thermobispora bispora]
MTEVNGSGGANGSTRGDRQGDPFAAAAGEAMRLIDAVQQRIARELGKGLVKSGMTGLGAVFGRTAGGHGGDVWSEAVAEGHGEQYICRACPVCRLIAAGREAGGDVTGHVLAAGGELLAALRQLLEALQREPAEPGGPGRWEGGRGPAEGS